MKSSNLPCRQTAAIFSPSSSRAMNFSRSSIWLHSFQGILRSPQKAQLCNPCLRNELSPLSQEGHTCQTYDISSNPSHEAVHGLIDFRTHLVRHAPETTSNC